MKTDKFRVVEEDGVVILDETDDYVPGEIRLTEDDDDLDIDYLINQTRLQEAHKRSERHRQRWVSVGVIITVIAFIAAVCYLNFKDILF